MGQTTVGQATLLVKIQGQGSRIVELEHATYTIGRKKDNDLAIEDPMVSGQHARIVKMQSVFFLEDLKSTNGTSVNGKAARKPPAGDASVTFRLAQDAVGSH